MPVTLDFYCEFNSPKNQIIEEFNWIEGRGLIYLLLKGTHQAETRLTHQAETRFEFILFRGNFERLSTLNLSKLVTINDGNSLEFKKDNPIKMMGNAITNTENDHKDRFGFYFNQVDHRIDMLKGSDLFKLPLPNLRYQSVKNEKETVSNGVNLLPTVSNNVNSLPTVSSNVNSLPTLLNNSSFESNTYCKTCTPITSSKIVMMDEFVSVLSTSKIQSDKPPIHHILLFCSSIICSCKQKKSSVIIVDLILNSNISIHSLIFNDAPLEHSFLADACIKKSIKNQNNPSCILTFTSISTLTFINTIACTIPSIFSSLAMNIELSSSATDLFSRLPIIVDLFSSLSSEIKTVLQDKVFTPFTKLIDSNFEESLEKLTVLNWKRVLATSDLMHDFFTILRPNKGSIDKLEKSLNITSCRIQSLYSDIFNTLDICLCLLEDSELMKWKKEIQVQAVYLEKAISGFRSYIAFLLCNLEALEAIHSSSATVQSTIIKCTSLENQELTININDWLLYDSCDFYAPIKESEDRLEKLVEFSKSKSSMILASSAFHSHILQFNFKNVNVRLPGTQYLCNFNLYNQLYFVTCDLNGKLYMMIHHDSQWKVCKFDLDSVSISRILRVDFHDSDLYFLVESVSDCSHCGMSGCRFFFQSATLPALSDFSHIPITQETMKKFIEKDSNSWMIETCCIKQFHSLEIDERNQEGESMSILVPFDFTINHGKQMVCFRDEEGQTLKVFDILTDSNDGEGADGDEDMDI